MRSPQRLDWRTGCRLHCPRLQIIILSYGGLTVAFYALGVASVPYLVWEFDVICCSKASSLGVEGW